MSNESAPSLSSNASTSSLTFRNQVLQLASSALDAAPRSSRIACVKEVTRCVCLDPTPGSVRWGGIIGDIRIRCRSRSRTNEEERETDEDDKQGVFERGYTFRTELGCGTLGMEAANTCSSSHSFQRLASLLQAAILSSLPIDEDDENSTVNLSLCHTLCRLLCRSRDISLLRETSRVLLGATSTSARTMRWLARSFVTTARRTLKGDTPKVKGDETDVVAFPALSLASIFSSSFEDAEIEKIRSEMMDLFLQAFSLQVSKSNGFAIASQLSLARTFLGRFVTQSFFDESLAPMLGLKMRAHPESVLPLAEIIFGSLVGDLNDVRGPKSKGRFETVSARIDGSSQLHTEGAGANLLPSTLKHLKSSKAEMRWLAWKVLILLAKLSGVVKKSSTPSLKSTLLVTDAICSSLFASTGALALNTSELRSGAYAALEAIANYIGKTLQAFDILSLSEGVSESIGKSADRVLSGLVGSLAKDKNVVAPATARTMGSEGTVLPALVAREVGYNALLAWMWISKNVLQTEKKSGYDLALDYVAGPVLKYSLKDGEFRFRIGSLVMPPSSSYLSFSLTGTSPPMTPSSLAEGAKGEAVVESIVMDLMEKKKIQQGLETVVDMAVKKHSASDAVAQVDGALALYIFSVYAHSTASAQSPSPIPSSTTKLIGAGSSMKGHRTSFLYSPTMLEAIRIDPLVNYLIHRTISLQCSIASKIGSEGTGQSKNEQPLVRVIERTEKQQASISRAVSAAAKALAVCIANPLCASSPRSALTTSHSSVHSSLKMIVYSSPVAAKATDAVLSALFFHINELSLKNELTLLLLNETRSSREQFEPIDESFARLSPIGSSSTSFGGRAFRCAPRGKLSTTAAHKGYDPNSIRFAAFALVSTALDFDSIWKALLLMHTGTTMRTNRRQRVALMGHLLNMLSKTVLPLVEKNSDGEEERQEGMIDQLADFVTLCAASSRFDHQHLSQTNQPKEAEEASCLAQEHSASVASRKSTEVGNKKEKKLESESQLDLRISPSINNAALSLITTLGGIAGNFDHEYDDEEDEEMKPYRFASKLCIRKMPTHLLSYLGDSMVEIKSMTEDDIALLRSRKGVLFRTNAAFESVSEGGLIANKTIPNPVKKKAASRKAKGGGFSSLADDEWERQVKNELEMKKRARQKEVTVSTEESLSSQEKELLIKQTCRREELLRILRGDFKRTLTSIRSLCESDIEVGNALLPMFGERVVETVVSKCAALILLDDLQKKCFETLSALAACVYEIEETHAPTLARALAISFRNGRGRANELKGECNSETGMAVCALPSPCVPAACSIFEMDEYGECLSGNSFFFLFPIIRAALTGPRNIPGCDKALVVLVRHCSMLAGEKEDVILKPLRKEMASSVLELLSHDRSQTFVNPTPYDALTACYTSKDSNESIGPALTVPELAPLLGERGALGNENARVAAMETLASIADVHPKLLRNNPLIESRIWLNCHDKKDRIRSAARKAWLAANDRCINDNEIAFPLDPPGKMYAVPLLPLLSHDDKSIVDAAASSLVHAMGMYPESTERNILKLCNAFISSFPASTDERQPKSISTPAPAPVPAPAPATTKKQTKKIIETGLRKKSTAKKTSNVSTSLAKITGAPAPRKVASTKKLLAKTASKVRTLDEEALMGQFKTESSAKETIAELDNDNKVATRMGVLCAISSFTSSSAKVKLDLPVLKILIGFLVAFGLGDGNEDVRSASRNGARDIIASHGSSEEAIAYFLPQFEAVLNTGQADVSCLGSLNPGKVPKSVTASDHRKEGVVVLLGSIALHLKNDVDESKIDSIIDMLLGALKTPSEDVQSSVALCLSKLMKKGRTQERIKSLLNDLMMECIHGNSLASRRGAAYGISAAVKGSGIVSLKKYEIVKRLEEACTIGSPSSKEGSLFAIELLSSRLGILFEPYVIVLLPALLKAFSDGNDHVRTAADKTVGLIMSNLSGHGVKLVMPAVLEAFNEPEWRTKQASIHMLGSMSHCAPKQLASCLPKVVPKLTEAFSDTHPKVKSSAEQSLEEITKVIKNPEISAISSTLLKALTDPADGTVKALEALIETEFLHAIDSPSLALIVPVLHRGLRDRAATTKRYGALISGNICTMINDPRDFVPYLPVLLPDLKSTLLDPIPDVRSISAKALGSLTRGLGEATFPDLRPWLIETLRSEGGSSVERSGAAQGLTEVLVAGGAHLTESIMINEILPLNTHPNVGTREGVLWVLTFLPSALGQAYASLIDDSLPALLCGLADDNETVRDVALRAGRVLVKSHGKAHKEKILPSLENGLSDEDYRIRMASLTLLGDLLSMLGGTKVVKGNADTQDDIRQAERAQAQIALALGNETRKRVLSSLYLSRSDTAAVVRQSAVQVWKTVVSVTPRTLREILSQLVDQIVSALASGDPERTQVAGRCLGDIVQKLGDQVLPEIIPVLRDSLYRGDEHTRQGVCVGLTEVIACSSKEQITKFLEIIVKVVQDALCDENGQVRKMAASCFQSLYQVVGARTLDEVVPALLVAMESSNEISKIRALNGMAGILSIRSRELLPYIIPRLLKPPLTISHADALGSISKATGDTIYFHFNTIIPTILMEVASFADAGSNKDEKVREGAIRQCTRMLCHNVNAAGVNFLINEIASKCSHDKESVRKEGCWFFQVVIEERKEFGDFFEHVPIMIRELLQRLNDDSRKVLESTNLALHALTTCVPSEELVTHIQFIRNLIASMVSDAKYRKGGVGDGQFFLPGFNMPKGLEPLLPIYQRGILYGDAVVRETAAAGLGELIAITSTKFLAGPFLIKLTGPLLRIVGDRNPSSVKIAIVQTLGLILTKGGPALRAFVPQFQTTFVKALSDPSRQVRIEAIKALSLLMPLSTRVDPLIKELVSSSLGKSSNASTETAGLVTIQTATLEALAVVLKYGGTKVKIPESIPSSLDVGKELVAHEDDGVRESAAKVIGYACELLGVEVGNSVLQELVVEKSSSISNSSSEAKHGIACVCRRVLSTSIGSKIDSNIFVSIASLILLLMKDDKTSVREAACVAIGAVLGSSSDFKSTLAFVEKAIARNMDSKENIEVQKAVSRGLCIVARMKPGIFRTQEGLFLMSNALKLAMSGAQRVQFSYNDFLWIALDVENGDEGLEEYLSLAHFDNAKTMKSIYSKVLVRIKCVDDND